ncbi:hypothetical protein Pmani_015733 [Petrolisthes manimaculis]|uniref:Uncharacterized protein n=1 Tax=Petrolisthes manimaculis TaxID=1843537 RepID=A0AAE1PQE4_9EUCA|nr:hypothetical protein Pmani_015733 [Petrolisthes manimaculis]
MGKEGVRRMDKLEGGRRMDKEGGQGGGSGGWVRKRVRRMDKEGSSRMDTRREWRMGKEDGKNTDPWMI